MTFRHKRPIQSTDPFAWWVPVPFLATRFSGEAKKKNLVCGYGYSTEHGRNKSSIQTIPTKMILGLSTSTLYRRCPSILVMSYVHWLKFRLLTSTEGRERGPNRPYLHAPVSPLTKSESDWRMSEPKKLLHHESNICSRIPIKGCTRRRGQKLTMTWTTKQSTYHQRNKRIHIEFDAD